jgi:glucose/arabinose dehydrogenase
MFRMTSLAVFFALAVPFALSQQEATSEPAIPSPASTQSSALTAAPAAPSGNFFQRLFAAYHDDWFVDILHRWTRLPFQAAITP